MINTATERISSLSIERVLEKKRSSFSVAIIFFVIFLIITLLLPPRSGNAGYFAALKDKHRLLQAIRTPKIIFVGGSNLAFGLDSNYLEKRFGRPVVNMGLCAPFGLRYLLEEVKNDIRAGDVVVLVPEYGILQNTVSGGPDLIHALEIYPCSAIFIFSAYMQNPHTALKLLQIARAIVIAKWDAFCKIVNASLKKGKYDPAVFERWEVNDQIGSSARFCFDKQGDYFGHFGSRNKPFSPLWEMIKGMDPEAASLINNFAQLAYARGAKVVLIPPAVPIENYINSQYSLRQFSVWPNQKLNIPVLATPKRYALPVSYFYEPPYHLNIPGRALRTKLIAEDLAPYLAESK